MGMTSSESDRILRALTEFRVDSAQRFGVLETQITALGGLPVAIEKLSGRVTALELQSVGRGKFTWGDLAKFVGALAASCVVLAALAAAIAAVVN